MNSLRRCSHVAPRVWPNRRRAFLTLLLAVCPVPGCGAGDRSGGEVVVRDSAGIQIVESAAPAWSEGSGWRVAREPRLRIGMVEGDSRYEFSRIVGGVRLSDGRIAILDAGSAQIRFFDGSGRYLASTGRSGGGPGEFAWPFALFRAPGDSLVAWDGSWAQLLFDPEGRFVRQNTLDRARLEIGPDYILAVERDELDVEYVVLFDLLKRT